jgi:hypothetical protein
MKEYQIDSFEKLINVMNDDNINNLFFDLGKWLIYTNHLAKEIRKKYPEETKGKLNSEIMECSFLWTDDGKNDWKGVEMINTDTGEVTKHNI